MCMYSSSIPPPCETNFKFKRQPTMSTFSFINGTDEQVEYDISALRCTSKTWKDMPEVVEDIIADYVKSMYVQTERRYDLAQRAHMCADLVKDKLLDKISAVQEDLAYARLWYENEVRDTEKMLYENKGKATDAAIEAAMMTRLQIEDERYQEYLHEANNYNNIIDDNQELLQPTALTWTYSKEIIDDRDVYRRIVAEEWITEREIDDGLWDPQGYAEDKDAPIHHLDDDGPAIGSGCWGCAEHQPNQQAHMGPGGCLHMSSDSGSFVDPYDGYNTEDYYLSDDDEPWWVSRYEDRLDR